MGSCSFATMPPLGATRQVETLTALKCRSRPSPAQCCCLPHPLIVQDVCTGRLKLGGGTALPPAMAKGSADRPGLTQRLIDNSSKVHKQSNALLLTKVRTAARHRSVRGLSRRSVWVAADARRRRSGRRMPSRCRSRPLCRCRNEQYEQAPRCAQITGSPPCPHPTPQVAALFTDRNLHAKAIGCFYLVFLELEAALRKAMDADEREG